MEKRLRSEEKSIDELVENLIEEGKIDRTESDNIYDSLKNASKDISNENMISFVKTIRQKIENPASGILTENGINISVLKATAEVIANVVIKEQVKNTEQSNKDSSFEYIQDNVDKINQEKEEKTLEEKIEDYKSDLDDMYRNMLGIDPDTISEAEKEEEAQELIKFEECIQKYNEYCKEGIPPEKAITKAFEGTGMDETEIKINASKVVAINAQKRVKKSDGTMSLEDAAQAELSSNSIYNEIYTEEKRDELVKAIAKPGLFRSLLSKTYEKKIESIQENIERINKSLEQKNDEGYYTYGLYNLMIERERSQRELRKCIKKRNKYNEPQESKSENKKIKIEQILKKAKDKYFTTAMTASEIYEKFRENGEIDEEVDVYDIIEAIANETQEHAEGTERIGATNNQSTIREYEIKMREEFVKIEALKKMIENAKKSTTITPEARDKLITAYNEDILKYQTNIAEKRSTTISIRNQVYMNLKNESDNEIGEQAGEQNASSREVSAIGDVTESIVTEVEEPKKKNDFLTFISKETSKLRTTSKEINEEISTLSSLQKQELEQAKEVEDSEQEM